MTLKLETTAPAATFKGEPLADQQAWAQKKIVERDLQRKKPAELQPALMPEVPDAKGQVSLF